jgi:hypothetical protein
LEKKIMRKLLGLVFGFALFFAVPVLAQEHHEAPVQHTEPHANGGHIPPAPPARSSHGAKPEVEKRPDGHVDKTPHVNNDHWYGHDKPNDARFRIAHPFEHGHFEHFGPSFRYNVERVDVNAHRFWFPGGFSFEIAAWDWPLASGWCWNCGDDFVVYEDTDHPGWYMLYNVQTGAYVHVQYLGA